MGMEVSVTALRVFPRRHAIHAHAAQTSGSSGYAHTAISTALTAPPPPEPMPISDSMATTNQGTSASAISTWLPIIHSSGAVRRGGGGVGGNVGPAVLS